MRELPNVPICRNCAHWRPSFISNNSNNFDVCAVAQYHEEIPPDTQFVVTGRPQRYREAKWKFWCELTRRYRECGPDGKLFVLRRRWWLAAYIKTILEGVL